MRTALVRWFDGGAVAASALCVAHCLLVPFAVALSPALSAVLDIPESFHLWVVVLAIPMSSIALLFGYRIHHFPGPVFKGLVGLVLLGAGVLYASSETMEVSLTVIGSILLVVAHVRNWTLRHGVADHGIV